MANEMMSNWGETAGGMFASPKTPNLKTGKQAQKSKGNIIMEVAEMLRPWLMQKLEGMRDKNGMVAQPAHIRGIALNIAQRLLNEQEKNEKANG